jgi:hypothetical protein
MPATQHRIAVATRNATDRSNCVHAATRKGKEKDPGMRLKERNMNNKQ